jgi:hypothetical protein
MGSDLGRDLRLHGLVGSGRRDMVGYRYRDVLLHRVMDTGRGNVERDGLRGVRQHGELRPGRRNMVGYRL